MEGNHDGETTLSLHVSLQLLRLRLDHQVNRFMGCDCHIDLYFRILKQGCQIEKLRLETPERLERCLAVYMIIAWRLHHLRHVARISPNAPCTVVFEGKKWQTIYLLQTYKRPPQKPPPLRTVTRMLAQLGGFLARKGDDEPGVETIWRGYMEMMRAVHTLKIAKAVGL
jgi:hypothetical protein